jgi:hypothetical protein
VLGALFVLVLFKAHIATKHDPRHLSYGARRLPVLKDVVALFPVDADYHDDRARDDKREASGDDENDDFDTSPADLRGEIRKGSHRTA